MIRLTQADIDELNEQLEQHYLETIEDCKRRGTPLWLIAKYEPFAFVGSNTFQRHPFESARNHHKGHGWKANHTS